jgi:hypothetical protein
MLQDHAIVSVSSVMMVKVAYCLCIGLIAFYAHNTDWYIPELLKRVVENVAV